MISLATVASRHVWLGLTALSKKDREDLLGAPVSSEGLFGSNSSVTQRFSRLEEERVQLSRMLPLAPLQAPIRVFFPELKEFRGLSKTHYACKGSG